MAPGVSLPPTSLYRYFFSSRIFLSNRDFQTKGDIDK